MNTLNKNQLEELSQHLGGVWQEKLILDVGKIFKDPDDSYFLDYYLCTSVLNGRRVGIGFSLDRRRSTSITLSEESPIPDDYVKVDHLDIRVGVLMGSVVAPFANFMSKWAFDRSI